MNVMMAALISLWPSCISAQDAPAEVVTRCAGWVPKTERVDCHPEPRASIAECKSRGCVWSWDPDGPDPTKSPNSPACFYPPSTGYSTSSLSGSPRHLYKDHSTSPYGSDAKWLSLTVDHYQQLMIISIFDPTVSKKQYSTHLQHVFPTASVGKAQKRPNADWPTANLRFEEFDKDDNGTDFYYFKVKREETNRAIFNTKIGGLVYAEKFVQIATFLPSDKIYGFGENPHQSFKHDLSLYKTWPMFARDEPPSYHDEQRKNLYGVHAFYVCIEPDGRAHGVFFINYHAQEVTLGPAPHLTYRAIGPELKIAIFPGPTPELVVQQYHAAIGRPVLPAYWTLGFQICRYGYKDTAEVRAVVNRTHSAGIPQDTQYVDIDYMDAREDFTYSGAHFSELPELIDDLHKKNMKSILILDPAIPADDPVFPAGVQQDVYISWWDKSDVPNTNDEYDTTRGTNILLGVVWPDNHTAFPDFFMNQTWKWWATNVVKLHDKLKFDGLWIDMNEPANFGTNEAHPWYFDNPTHFNTAPPLNCSIDEWEQPPYMTWAVYWHKGSRMKSQQLSDKTLCMAARHGGVRHYTLHNLYGLTETMATQRALVLATGKRGIVISRSTFASSGAYGGHWLGDNTSEWPDLRASIIGVLEMNLFGIPYSGADICGFNGDTTEELCLRWHQLGAFYPMSRNHNTIGAKPQDPGQWPNTVAKRAREAYTLRYRLLPYLFSLHLHVALHGGTVVRPLFWDFGNDMTTYNIDEQFMWGDALLITPVVHQGHVSVTGYFPAGHWYTLAGAAPYGSRVADSGFVTLDAPLDQMIPVHLRGGRIIPAQAHAFTTDQARQHPLQLLVAVQPNAQVQKGCANATGADLGGANGFVYWDDGDSPYDDIRQHEFWALAFTYEQHERNATLETSVITAAPAEVTLPPLILLEVFGCRHSPVWSSFKVNGSPVYIDYTTSHYDEQMEYLVVKFKLPILLSQGPKTSLTWLHGFGMQ